MRKLISATIILVVAGAATARAQQMTPAELQALARYAQVLQEVYQGGAAISISLDDTALVIDDFINGDATEAEMRAVVEEELRLGRVRIDQYQSSLSAVGQRSPISDAKREAGMRAFETMVRDLKDHLDSQRENVETLLKAALAGDETAYDWATADSLALAVDLLRSENTAIESAQQGLKRSHPQHGLYDAVAGGNLAMQAAFVLMENALRGRPQELEMASEAIGQGLKRAELGLKEGRLSARSMHDGAAGMTARGESDEISRQFLKNLAGAYDRAFDVEARAVDAMRKFVNALTGTMKSGEDADFESLVIAAETFQAEAQVLIERRFAEQNERVLMVQEFSAALAALQ